MYDKEVFMMETHQLNIEGRQNPYRLVASLNDFGYTDGDRSRSRLIIYRYPLNIKPPGRGMMHSCPIRSIFSTSIPHLNTDSPSLEG